MATDFSIGFVSSGHIVSGTCDFNIIISNLIKEMMELKIHLRKYPLRLVKNPWGSRALVFLTHFVSLVTNFEKELLPSYEAKENNRDPITRPLAATQ